MRTTKKIELVLEKMYTEHASYFHDLTTLLPAILAELRQIKKILEGAAKEPEPKVRVEHIPTITLGYVPKEDVQETEPKDLTLEVKQDDLVTGSEAAKMLGWRSCSAKMLDRAGIMYQQEGKYQKLSVSRFGIEIYLQTKRTRKNG